MPTQLQYLKKVIGELFKRKNIWPFKEPVDVVKLGLTEYNNIVKKPMDFGTIKKRLNSNHYRSAAECIDDINLVFTNCYIFNPPGDDVVIMALEIQKLTYEKLKNMPSEKEVQVQKPGRKRNLSKASCASSHSNMSESKASSVPSVAENRGPIINTVHPNGDKVMRPSNGNLPASSHIRNQPVKRRLEVETDEEDKLSTHASKGVKIAKLSIGSKEPPEKRAKNSPALKKCSTLLKDISSTRYKEVNHWFLKPVDAKSLKLNDYHDIIKRPMDLGTVKNKLKYGEYKDEEQFASDVRLMFTNCYLYNGVYSHVGRAGQSLQAIFEKCFTCINEESKTAGCENRRTKRKPTPTVSSGCATNGPNGLVDIRRQLSISSSSSSSDSADSEPETDLSATIPMMEEEVKPEAPEKAANDVDSSDSSDSDSSSDSSDSDSSPDSSDSDSSPLPMNKGARNVFCGSKKAERRKSQEKKIMHDKNMIMSKIVAQPIRQSEMNKKFEEDRLEEMWEKIVADTIRHSEMDKKLEEDRLRKQKVEEDRQLAEKARKLEEVRKKEEEAKRKEEERRAAIAKKKEEDRLAREAAIPEPDSPHFYHDLLSRFEITLDPRWLDLIT